MPNSKRQKTNPGADAAPSLDAARSPGKALAEGQTPSLEPAHWPDAVQWLDAAVQRHVSYRHWTLNLIASENVMSPDVARYYNLELSHRYGNYRGQDLRDRSYFGNKHIIELEERALADACSLFHAGAADLRPLSGHVGGSAVIMGLCKPNDLVLELDKAAGGHILTEKLCKARLLQLRIEAIPFDDVELQVDVPATVRKIKQSRPRLVIVGSSNFLFPTPLEEIAVACREVGATLLMDASHVLGLIAGGVFPQPMDQGADLIISSTHKTLAGPQGGILLGRTGGKELEELTPALFPGLVTNHHLHRIPAMIALFAEWRTYGAAYAAAIVANAVKLAEALEAIGVAVVRTSQGATRSHTLLIKDSAATQTAKRLESCGIIAGTMSLPAVHGGACIRIGVQEITRMGFGVDASTATKQIDALARLIRDAMVATDPEPVIKRVQALTQNLQTVHFCHSHAHGLHRH